MVIDPRVVAAPRGSPIQFLTTLTLPVGYDKIAGVLRHVKSHAEDDAVTVDLSSIRLRIIRAEAKLNTLERSVLDFSPNLERYRVVVDVEEEGLKQVARVRFEWKSPDWWGLATGEIVHHLRSVLDNLVWQLVIANGAVPDGDSEFPIARDYEWFDKVAPKKLRGVRPPVAALIRRLQPCHGRDREAAARHPLWVLNQLDIVDKHHQVHTAAKIAGQASFNWEQPHIDAGGRTRLWFRPLDDGTPIQEFFFDRPCTRKVQVEGTGPLEIQILETERTPYLPFPGYLRQLHDFTTRIVGTIANTEREESRPA